MDGLQWCRDRLLVPGNPLTASLLFVDDREHDRILALRTLVSELAALAQANTDESVSSAKLGWWRQALVEGAAHPALQAMAQSGAIEQVPGRVFVPLLEHIARDLSRPRFERFEQLQAHCSALGGEAARLEALLADSQSRSGEAAVQMGSAGYLLRIVRDLGVDARSNRWLVPLDVQAQFQVSRTDVIEKQGGPGWDGLVRTLVERALRAGDQAAAGLSARQVHLHICWALDRRLGAQLARRPRHILTRRVMPGHAGNVWLAWRVARRMKRAATG